nr:ubiquitin-like domain-containing protein CIP73 [Ipomoea batatas]
MKEEVTLVTGVLAEHQRLIFRGKALSDDKQLSDYHVEDGDTLHLIVTTTSHLFEQLPLITQMVSALLLSIAHAAANVESRNALLLSIAPPSTSLSAAEEALERELHRAAIMDIYAMLGVRGLDAHRRAARSIRELRRASRPIRERRRASRWIRDTRHAASLSVRNRGSSSSSRDQPAPAAASLMNVIALKKQMLLRIEAEMMEDHQMYNSQDLVGVGALKEKVTLVTGVLAEHQRLIFHGKALSNDKQLSDYHVGDGDTLHLIVTTTSHLSEQLPLITQMVSALLLSIANAAENVESVDALLLSIAPPSPSLSAAEAALERELHRAALVDLYAMLDVHRRAARSIRERRRASRSIREGRASRNVGNVSLGNSNTSAQLPMPMSAILVVISIYAAVLLISIYAMLVVISPDV